VKPKQTPEDASAISDKEVLASASAVPQSGYLGRVAYTASFAGRVRSVESLAYVYCSIADEWTVKYRITYPDGADVRPVIVEFIRNLKWTLRMPNKAP